MTHAFRLDGVSKVFRQRRPTPGVRGWLRPTFKEIRALDGIDLAVDAGEIIAYAGPNGAGKSTTIKLLCGMLRPDTGRVEALGLDPAADRVRYVGRIGVVFGQRTELWWDQPVSASFDWKRVVWDVDGPRYERSRDQLVGLLGIGELWNTLARELSLGQRMRVDLALALLPEPELVFLDEPTLGLDVLAKRTMIELLRQLNRDRGVTVLVTSHDMGELEELAGRIVMIDHGRLAFEGPFAELRRLVPDRRSLAIDSGSTAAPDLGAARLVRSDGTRHEYEFDASHVSIGDLLARAGHVDDVETSRLPIDDVIADLYERWIASRQ